MDSYFIQLSSFMPTPPPPPPHLLLFPSLSFLFFMLLFLHFPPLPLSFFFHPSIFLLGFRLQLNQQTVVDSLIVLVLLHVSADKVFPLKLDLWGILSSKHPPVMWHVCHYTLYLLLTFNICCLFLLLSHISYSSSSPVTSTVKNSNLTSGVILSVEQDRKDTEE